MSKYCVNKAGDHEICMISCSYLPEVWNRIEFEAMNDLDAMAKAKGSFSNDDGCAHCMSVYHKR